MSTHRRTLLPLILAAAALGQAKAAVKELTLPGGGAASVTLAPASVANGAQSLPWTSGSDAVTLLVNTAVGDTTVTTTVAGAVNLADQPLTFLNNGTLGTARYTLTGGAADSLTVGVLSAGARTTVAIAPTLALNNAGGVTLEGAGRFLITGGLNSNAAIGVAGTTLEIGALTNGGVAGSLGTAGGAATNLVLGGDATAAGVLRLTGGVASDTDRLFTVVGNARIEAAGAAVRFTNTGVIAFAGAAGTTDTLTLAGDSAAANTFAAQLRATAGGATVALTKAGDTTWTLAHAGSDHTGATTLSNGVLVVTKLADGGVASSLGAASANAGNLVFDSGPGLVTATLRYAGAGDATNRLLTMNGDAVIENAGAGALRFTGTGDLAGTPGNTLTLAGTQAGDNLLAARITSGSLTKSGAGKWILSGDNTYTGVTTVTGGTLQIGDGGATGATGSGTVAVAAGATLEFRRTGTLVVAGTISGGGALVQSGAGTLVLTDNNTYAGTTTIAAGTLQVGNGGAAGALGAGAVVNDGTLAFDRTDAVTVANAISGAGNLAHRGAGVVTLTGANTYAGTTEIASGTLRVGAGGTAGSLGAGAVINNGTLAFNRADTVTLANALSGSGALIQQGAGTLVLTADNSRSGVTEVRSGTLQVGAGGATGALGSGAVTNDGTLVFDRAGTLTVAATIGGSGTLIKRGAGTVVLAADNTLTGPVTVEQGTLQFGSGNLTGAPGGSTIAVNAGATVAVANAGFVTLTNAVSGAGALEQRGTGTLALAASVSTQTVVIASGTLQVGVGGSAGELGAATVVNDGTLTFDRSDAVTVANVISGSGQLIQRGADTVTLTGANTYAGTTEIASGTLMVGAGGATGSLGAGAVINNGTLAFNRADTVTLANALSGSGALIQQGAGTLVLTADNTRSGVTEVRSGTLQVGAGGTTGALGSGAVTNDGTLVFDRAGTLTVAAPIGGSGTLIKRGAGTVVLAADNTLTGPVTVEQGTLQFGSSNLTGVPGGSAITVSAGATVAVANAGFITLTNAVSGAGALEQRGTGTLALAASVSTQTVVIASGTLQVGVGGAAGALGAAAVVNDATLAFDRSDAVTVANVISGSGRLIQRGAGAVTLTGANTYAGVTEIAAGTLVVGGGGNLGGGAVVNNGTLVFDRADALTVTTALSGSGALVKQGAGTLTLAGDNTATGTVTIREGTLAVDGMARLGEGSVTVNGRGTLALDHGTGTHTLTQGAAGEGVFALRGAGATLAGANLALPALTAVESGHTLDLGGKTLATELLRIDDGATLRGSGTIAGGLTNGGAVAPGNSPGVITVNGDFVNESTGVVTMEIGGVTPGVQYDQIRYTGRAVIRGGTLNIALINGYTPALGTSFRLLVDEAPEATAAVSGAFTTVNTPVFGFLTANAGAEGLTFTVVKSLAALPAITVATAVGPYADMLSALGATDPRTAHILSVYSASGAGAAQAALESASPLGLVGTHALVIDEAREFAAVIRGRAADRREAESAGAAAVKRAKDSAFATFAAAHTLSAKPDDSRSAARFDHRVQGGLAGLEYRPTGALALGLALGYDTGKADIRHGGGAIEQDRVSLAAYTTAALGRTGFIGASAFTGSSSYDIARRPPLGETGADTDGKDFGGTLEIGCRTSPKYSVSVTPTLGLVYTHTDFGAFTETGGPFALAVDADAADSLRVRLGTDVDWKTRAAGTTVFLGATLAYEHELMDTKSGLGARLADGSGTPFTTDATFQERDSVTVGPHLSVQFSEALATTLGHRCEIGFNGTITQRFDAAIRYRF